MSEKELKELADYVFSDARLDDEFEELTKKIQEEQNLRKKIDIFQKKPKSIPDVERLKVAFESYKKYKFFSKLEKIKKRPDHNYFFNYKGVWITADLLTGPSRILAQAKKLIDDNQSRKEEIDSALDLFCSVVYTIGNCCPTMKNPHSSINPEIKKNKDWDDSCWWKLNYCLKLNARYTGIENEGWDDNFNKRDSEKMFAVFPDNLTGKEIVDRLMLNDYYEGKRLVVSPIAQGKNEDNEEYINRFIDLMKAYTFLIVKRGIRIYKENNIEGINLDQLTEELLTKKKKELAKSCTSQTS